MKEIDINSYIDGLLLSDGSISDYGINKRYKQQCKHEEWLNVIKTYFHINKINSSYYFRKNCGFNQNSYIYDLWTNSYSIFSSMRERWYKKWYEIDSYNKRLWHLDEYNEWFIWKKIVPRDINLTPECTANWYLGDGSIMKQHKYENSYRITLSTDGFLLSDVELLSKKLLDIGVNNKINKARKKHIINIIRKESIVNFLDYVKDFKVSCYSYKFPKELLT